MARTTELHAYPCLKVHTTLIVKGVQIADTPTCGKREHARELSLAGAEWPLLGCRLLAFKHCLEAHQWLLA